MVMKRLFLTWSQFFARRSAEAVVEYSVVLFLISMTALFVLHLTGQSVNKKLTDINSNLQDSQPVARPQ